MSLMLEALEQRHTDSSAAKSASIAAASAPLAGHGLNSAAASATAERTADEPATSLDRTPRPRWQVLGAVALGALLAISAGTAFWRAQSGPKAGPAHTPPAPGVVGESTPPPTGLADAAPPVAAASVIGKHITEVDTAAPSPTTARGDPRAPIPGKPAAPAQPTPHTPTPTQPGALGHAKASANVDNVVPPTKPARMPVAGNTATADKLQLQRVVPPDSAAAAWAKMAAGQHEEALAQYRRVLARQPDDVESLVGAASLLHRAGDREAAYQHYRRALAVSPNHAGAMSGMLQLMGEADPATAESRLKDFIESHASDDSAHAALGQLLARQGRWSEAQGAFFQAHTQRPERASHAYNLAVALDRLHHTKQAIEFYRLATTLRSQGDVPVAAARQRIEKLAASLATPAAAAPAEPAQAARAEAPKSSWWKRSPATDQKPPAEETLP